eukprot:scaffold391_cov198-Isochrysis_galbana.AAC.1
MQWLPPDFRADYRAGARWRQRTRRSDARLRLPIGTGYVACRVSRASAAVLLAGGRDLEVWGTAGRAAVQ